MAEDRIITLRFKAGNSMDRELYQKLEQEKENLGLSMPVYVKEILRRRFENRQDECAGMTQNPCFTRLQELMHEEFASLRAVLMRMLTHTSEGGFEPVSGAIGKDSSSEKEDALPEYSDELPEGVDSILEQFL